jgi:hypothetical protein
VNFTHSFALHDRSVNAFAETNSSVLIGGSTAEKLPVQSERHLQRLHPPCILFYNILVFLDDVAYREASDHFPAKV